MLKGFKGLMVLWGAAAGVGLVAGGATYAAYKAIEEIPWLIKKMKVKHFEKKFKKDLDKWKTKQREEEYNIVYYLDPDEYEVESL